MKSDPPSKSQRAYAWIRDRIAKREFGPGYRLVLGTIAERLGMSVVPVREAVRQLEAEGLITFERNVGARVILIDEPEYVHTMQTLGVVEGSATALAAPFLSDRALDRAAEINERLSRGIDHLDPHALTRLKRAFHAVLCQACPNPHIVDLVQRGWARLDGLRDTTFEVTTERARQSVDEHDDLIGRIRSGATANEIELAARDHRWRTMNAFLASRRPDNATTGGTGSHVESRSGVLQGDVRVAR